MILNDGSGESNQILFSNFDPSDGCYTFVNINSYKSIGVKNSQDNAGTQISQYNITNADTQKWRIIPTGDGYYNFELKSNGLVLDVKNAETAKGTPIQLCQKDGSDKQKFEFNSMQIHPSFKQGISSEIEQVRKISRWKRINLSENITPEFERTFEICANLEHINILPAVKSIKPTGIFRNLSKVTIAECDPRWLEHFDKSRLKQIIIPEGIPEIKDIKENYFKNCVNLESIKIPSSVTHIDEGAFKDCKNIKSADCDQKWCKYFGWNKYTVDKSCLFLKKEIFDNWTSLKSLEIPIAITAKNIEPGAFQNCNNIIDLNCHPELLQQFGNKQGIKKVTIPNGITEIKKDSFKGYVNLEQVIIPDTVKIDEGTFDDCKKLHSVKCNPKSYKFINLESFSIPSDMKITKEIFQGWTNLRSLEIPYTIEKIEPGSLDSCQRLTKIKCNPKILKYLSEERRAKLEQIIVPDKVTNIDKTSFKGCTNLNNLVLANSVMSIEDGAFDDCKNLVGLKCDSKLRECFTEKNFKQEKVSDQVKNTSAKSINYEQPGKVIPQVSEWFEERTQITTIQDMVNFDKSNERDSAVE